LLRASNDIVRDIQSNILLEFRLCAEINENSLVAVLRLSLGFHEQFAVDRIPGEWTSGGHFDAYVPDRSRNHDEGGRGPTVGLYFYCRFPEKFEI